MQNILIIQTAFLGDTILATSLIESLHAAYPNAKIDFVLRKGNEAIYQNHPYLNKIFVWNKHKKYKSLLHIIKQLRKKRYDLLINCQRFTNTGIISFLAKAKHKTGFKKNPLSFCYTEKYNHQYNNTHEIERNFQLIKKHVNTAIKKPKLYPSNNDIKEIANLKINKPYITISPASVWFTKQFPKNKWIDFINQVPNDYTICLIGGNSDFALCSELQKQSKHTNTRNLSGKLSILQSAELMKHATMNYTNDSAPMHIASAMNAPTCAIYCSTIPHFGFGPLADTQHIIQVEKNLKCRPCGLHGKKQCPEKHFYCAQKIDINKMLEIIKHQ